MIRACAAALLAALPGICGADQPPDLVLDCAIGSKRLEVHVGAGQASYAFGPSGRPELALTLSLDETIAMPWPGVGRTIWESISFQNNDVTYEVWITLDRLDLGQTTSGGVTVSRSGETLAELQCTEGTAQVGIFAIADAMEAAGYCVDRDQGGYTKECPDT